MKQDETHNAFTPETGQEIDHSVEVPLTDATANVATDMLMFDAKKMYAAQKLLETGCPPANTGA